MTKRKAPPLEVAGIIKVISPHGGPQLLRAQRRRPAFDKWKRQRFIDALALTCNVRMSVEYAGVFLSTVYRARTRDPVFAAQWREALEMGMERLEMLVVEHGGAGLPLDFPDAERALDGGIDAPPFDFDKAIRALQLHAKARAGIARKPNHPAPSAEETDAAITTLLGKMRVRALNEPAPALPAPDVPDEPEDV